ncbi:MAG: cohesin domain-containing protein [Ardenticatenaceae bacterium]
MILRSSIRLVVLISTMAILLLYLLSVDLFFNAALSADGSNFLSNTISIGSGEVLVGQSITLPLTAAVISGTLGAATIDVQYDPDVVDATACQPDPDNRLDFTNCNSDFSPDTLRFSALSPAGISGNLLLAEIGFQAVGQIGESSVLTVTAVTLIKPSGQPLPVTTQNGELTISLETPPTSLAISGPASGCHSGEHNFTAIVQPDDSTTPLTYTWQATDQQPITQSHDELMHTVFFNWTHETPFGDKTITVSAANLSGMVTNSHTINIQAIACTPMPTVTPPPTPSNTPTPNATVTGTPPTNTPTPTVTATGTNTPTPSVTATSTNTPTPSPTVTGTPPTNTPTPTVTATGTNTPTPTVTATGTITDTEEERHQLYLPLLLNGSSPSPAPTFTPPPPPSPVISNQ